MRALSGSSLSSSTARSPLGRRDGVRADQRVVGAGPDELVAGVGELSTSASAWYGANGVFSGGSQVVPSAVQAPLESRPKSP